MEEFWHKTRTTILVITIISFFALCTVFLILFAQGKRLTTGGFVDTGVLKLEVVPDNADVFINGKEVGLKGNRVQGIELGKLDIEIKKEGYTTWHKMIEVDNQEVKTIYAELYPLNPIQKIVFEGMINKIVVSPDSSYIIFSVLDDSTEKVGLWKYKYRKSLLQIATDPEPELFATLDDNELQCLKNNNYELIISDDNEKLILRCDKDSILTLLDLNNNNIRVNLKEVIGYMPEKVQWLNNSRSLLIKDKTVLFEMELATTAKYYIYYDPIKEPVFAVSQNHVYFISPNGLTLNDYTNQDTNSLFNTNLHPLPSDIISLSTGYDTDDIFIFLTKDALYYWDLSENVYAKKDGEFKILEFASNGTDILIEDLFNNGIYSLLATHTIKDERLLMDYNKVPALEESSIGFTASGTLLYRIEENISKLFDIYLMDSDGQNENKFVNEISLLDKFVLLDEENKVFFYATYDETNIAGNGLYRIDLEEVKD